MRSNHAAARWPAPSVCFRLYSLTVALSRACGRRCAFYAQCYVQTAAGADGGLRRARVTLPMAWPWVVLGVEMRVCVYVL